MSELDAVLTAPEAVATPAPSFGVLLHASGATNTQPQQAKPQRDARRLADIIVDDANGWAVRKETEPDHVTLFPGRELLYRDSHAFHALRSFLYAHGEKLDEGRFPSEGTVSDLVGQSHAEHARAEEATRSLGDQRKRDILTTSAKEVESEVKLENDALDAFELRGYLLGFAYQQSSDAPVDMTSSQILIDDLVASAEALGALGLDATPALRAAEPGAFLDGDIHMTPKGQRAFAVAIAAKLEGSRSSGPTR